MNEKPDDDIPTTPCARCGTLFLAYTAQTILCPKCIAKELTEEAQRLGMYDPPT